MDAPFEWDAPGLKEGGDWCEAQLEKLRTITEGWHDQYLVMIDARLLLASHRLNYTSQGAQRLEILWWECPTVWLAGNICSTVIIVLRLYRWPALSPGRASI
jgi:hypothetical protein